VLGTFERGCADDKKSRLGACLCAFDLTIRNLLISFFLIKKKQKIKAA